MRYFQQKQQEHNKECAQHKKVCQLPKNASLSGLLLTFSRRGSKQLTDIIMWHMMHITD